MDDPNPTFLSLSSVAISIVIASMAFLLSPLIYEITNSHPEYWTERRSLAYQSFTTVCALLYGCSEPVILLETKKPANNCTECMKTCVNMPIIRLYVVSDNDSHSFAIAGHLTRYIFIHVLNYSIKSI